MGAIPRGYTAGVWLDTDPGVVVATSTAFTSYSTEVDLAQGFAGIDPSTDLRAVQCAWESARMGGNTGNSGGFSYWGGLNAPHDYTCAPIPNPIAGSGGSVGSQSWVGDSIEYEGFFGGFLYAHINALTYVFQSQFYVGSAWYQANPPVIPTGALLDWESTQTAAVTNIDLTVTSTALSTGPGCGINVSPIYAATSDAQFLTATTSGNNFILPGAGGTAGTAASGGSVTVSTNGAGLYQFSSNSQIGVIVIRSSLVDADVSPTTTNNVDVVMSRAVSVSVQLTITAIPPRHRFFYPAATVPPAVTSPPVTGFTVTSGNWYQDDGATDLNVIGDGKPLRFYSPSNSADSITIHFGAINLGTTTIGFADLYVVGGSFDISLSTGALSQCLSSPFTVYAADGSVIQTTTASTDPSWFPLIPDVRLAGGCSISFTVPPRTFVSIFPPEFWISAVILELRTTQTVNTISLQQGSGLARFDDIVAMR